MANNIIELLSKLFVEPGETEVGAKVPEMSRPVTPPLENIIPCDHINNANCVYVRCESHEACVSIKNDPQTKQTPKV